jgi:hypothetical protein
MFTKLQTQHFFFFLLVLGLELRGLHTARQVLYCWAILQLILCFVQEKHRLISR